MEFKDNEIKINERSELLDNERVFFFNLDGLMEDEYFVIHTDSKKVIKKILPLMTEPEFEGEENES